MPQYNVTYLNAEDPEENVVITIPAEDLDDIVEKALEGFGAWKGQIKIVPLDNEE